MKTNLSQEITTIQPDNIGHGFVSAASPLDSGFSFLTTRRPAQGWRFILHGQAFQPVRLTARLDGSNEPGNLKPLPEMAALKSQGHVQCTDRV
jgi:hypothetical protein